MLWVLLCGISLYSSGYWLDEFATHRAGRKKSKLELLASGRSSTSIGRIPSSENLNFAPTDFHMTARAPLHLELSR